VALLAATLGLRADAQSGQISIRPLPAVGPLEVTSLRFAGHAFSAAVCADGTVTTSGLIAQNSHAGGITANIKGN
jgi:hypothetical protein